MLIGGCGVIYCLFKYGIKTDKTIIDYIKISIPIVLCSFVSMLYNSTNDFWMIQFLLLNIIYIIGGFFLIDVFKITDVYKIAKIFIYCVLANIIIALMGLVFSPISDVILGMQADLNSSKAGVYQMQEFKSRAIGFGIGNFFTGGIINAIGLIFLCFLYKDKKINLLKFLILLVLIFFLGCFIARTTIIGLIGVLIFLFPLHKNFAKIFYLAIIPCVLYVSFLIFKSIAPEGIYLDWAFELFYSMGSSDEVGTSSSDTLIEMYANTRPKSLKTWIIGDGMFFDRFGAYYMHTDIGYFRIIFYFGIIGLLFFLISEFYMTYSVYKKDHNLKYMLICSMICMLLGNIKGFCDIIPYISLLAFSNKQIR